MDPKAAPFSVTIKPVIATCIITTTRIMAVTLFQRFNHYRILSIEQFNTIQVAGAGFGGLLMSLKIHASRKIV